MGKGIKIPLCIRAGSLERTSSEKQSIDESISLFLNTPKWSLVADSDYGFVFAGLRFEIFDENNGTVYNSSDEFDPIYKKKISGSSKNLDTFASDLRNGLIEYEPRLKDITTTMTYVRERRFIVLLIRGTLVRNALPYEYKTTIKVWN